MKMVKIADCIEYVKRQLKEDYSHCEITVENNSNAVIVGKSLSRKFDLTFVLKNGKVDFSANG
jgi:hypothetical protein